MGTRKDRAAGTYTVSPSLCLSQYSQSLMLPKHLLIARVMRHVAFVTVTNFVRHSYHLKEQHGPQYALRLQEPTAAALHRGRAQGHEAHRVQSELRHRLEQQRLLRLVCEAGWWCVASFFFSFSKVNVSS